VINIQAKGEPTVEGAFGRFLEGVLAITTDQRSRAAASRENLLDTLKTRRKDEPMFPRLLRGFLSGSYDRFTKNPPLDDIDLMVVMDGAGLYPEGDGTKLTATVEGSDAPDNPLTDERYDDDQGRKSSIRVLNVFKSALDDAYKKSEVVRDGQAVRVWLKSYELGFDVVPCVHVVPALGGSKDYYLIPKGDRTTLWLATNPQLDAERLDGLDKKQNGRMRGTVKLLKRWNDRPNRGRLRPYHLEVMALNIFELYSIKSYLDALRYFFTAAPGRLGQPCPDPSDLGPNVDRYLDQEQRDLSLEAVGSALEAVQTAVDQERKGNYEAAVAALRTVLGDDFPG
jgi:hypothetical protein